MNENNDKIRQWVIRFLDKSLRLTRYKTFIHCRDESVGVNREEALISKIHCSKNYIIILCEKYSTSKAHCTTIEWKLIWNSFRENTDKQIIILNFDQMDSCDVENTRLRAFLCVGLDIDFSNRNYQLLKSVKKRLGDPLHTLTRIGNRRSGNMAMGFYRNDLVRIEI